MIGETISHYRVIEKIGEGGMGVVYLAEHTLLGRRVAIKTISANRDGQDQHFRSRFLREAQAVSKLSHPNIATVYDYGETDSGQPYIVMELIEGQTLADLMRGETLTIARAIEIIKQTADALGEAHVHGIVHRDIKPSNIALNTRGVVKVLDFGLAKQVVSPGTVSAEVVQSTAMPTQTREDVRIGTPLYMSPEQALGLTVDGRSDLFSLGSVLYESIAGRPAFAGRSDIEICAKIIRDDPPPPSELNGKVSPDLDRIVLRALSKQSEARYQSAEEMVTDLENARSRVLSLDRAVTRLKAPANGTPPRSALTTISDIFRRPRLSIGYVAAVAALVVAISILGYKLSRARPHKPTTEAQQLYITGTNALRAGSFFQASKALELATRADDQFAIAHARLADALMELDYFDRAKDEILRASELTPDRSALDQVDRLYLDALTATVRRNFPGAVQAYAQISRLQPDTAEAYFDLARAYEKDNQSNKAAESYLEVTKRDPQFGSAFLRLGVLYGRKRDMDASKIAFDKADQIYQSHGNVEGRTEVTLQRGALLNDIVQKPDEARGELEHARDMARLVSGAYQQIRILYQLSNAALKQNKGGEAKQFATQAVELAQANQMETLIARGYLEMGNVDFALGDYPSADQNFQQGLELAQKFGARQNEARARLSLASLNVQRGDSDQAIPYLEQAISFYQSGAYRTETNQAMNLRARIYRQKGDYNSALKSLTDQLDFAQKTNDQAQLAAAHSSIGYLLFDEEKYTEALEHFEQNYQINKTLNNQLNLGYAVMNRGVTQWRLGHITETRSDLEQASALADREDVSFKELQANIALIEGQVALGDRRFAEAIAKSRQALKLAGASSKVVAVRGKCLQGLAQALSGQARAGQATCDEAVTAAAGLGDPLLLARAQLALAEACLAAGDATRAIATVQSARTFFANVGLAEAEWRAWLIEGLATQRIGDRDKAQSCFATSAKVLSSLEQKWGAEVYKSYSDRPDIREYRKQLN